MDQLEKYCSPRFKTGEELDKALAAALCSCDDAARAEVAAAKAEGAAQAVAEATKTLDAKVESVFGELEGAGSRFSAIETDIADLKYKPIEITAFAHDLPVQELGAVVSTVTLVWALNKAPASLKLDGATVDTTLTEKTLTGQVIKGNKTFTLVATDEREVIASKTATLSFYNGIYYGAAVAPASIDSAFVLGLGSKVLTGTKNRTVKITGGDGLYAWYAYPKRLGKSLFNIGGFDYEWGLETISFTNSLGYAEDYYVYRSGQYAPASLSVTVKDGG